MQKKKRCPPFCSQKVHQHRTHSVTAYFRADLDTTSGGRLLIGKVRSPVCRMALICALLIYGSGSLLVRTKRSAHLFELNRAGASVAKQP